MKLHKIRNVEKEVCTCEQKIAYNYAVSNYDNIYQDKERIAECVKRDLERRSNGDMKKYDCNAIFQIFVSNFENYKKAKYHILTSYDEIGNAFPIHEM
jgi:hypothetical protein